ncbi:uncharacterized protein LOC106532049 [Austrofundulus limnaeus]|uniref:Uncharacterized protein LOC106532049 n=1 Tax=Austrofundulus limnaeus TaxID=52670 RepID=A0A2I4CU28_AUSLI|nr:PREDICTED: uncharacterized protein LOC106532049 [Austrofundulus limnaeus]
MWTPAVDLYLGLVLVLSQLLGPGGSVKVLCRPSRSVSLPCSYHYEDRTNVSQLSVQWRSPHNELLCHYIKHKSFQNCSAGYTIRYRPGSIQLLVLQVRTRDIGTHICSVSKRHDFSDFRVELAVEADSTTSTPVGGANHSGVYQSHHYQI